MPYSTPSNKKGRIWVLAVLFLLPFLLLFPDQANAQYTDVVHTPIGGVNAAVNTISGAANPVTAVSSTYTAGLTSLDYIKKFVLDGLANSVAKSIIRKLTAQTVNWINSGFKGNPMYVRDTGQFFLDVGDSVASDFFSGTSPLNNLCSPFKAQVRLALVKNYLAETSNKSYSCTIDKMVSNYDSFTNDFSQGGWDSWFVMTQSDFDNPYGSYLQGKSDLQIQVGSKTTKYKDQLSQGQGFLSWETCDDSASGSSTSSNEGSKRNVCLKAVIKNSTDPGDLGTNVYYKEPDYGPVDNNCIQSDMQIYQNGKWVHWDNSDTGSARVDAGSSNPLNGCESGKTKTNTPGSVINSQLQNLLGSGVKQLELTNSINQVVSALMTQLVQRVVGGLGNGLMGASQSSSNSTSNSRSLIQQMVQNPSDTGSVVGQEDAALQKGIWSGVPKNISATGTAPAINTPETPSFEEAKQSVNEKKGEFSTGVDQQNCAVINGVISCGGNNGSGTGSGTGNGDDGVDCDLHPSDPVCSTQP